MGSEDALRQKGRSSEIPNGFPYPCNLCCNPACNVFLVAQSIKYLWRTRALVPKFVWCRSTVCSVLCCCH
ncbi:ST-I family heat-stable enterotoxin [candidate division WWE3 bacterium]|nr:ST-I family heat-stable enterotoxin [candidate division WWE3 bacterium]MBT7349801.1 ST-I family heat-stable enterotoxin [candidate division WWE3 bacterium]